MQLIRRTLLVLTPIVLLACAGTVTAPVSADFTLAVGDQVAIRGTPITIRLLEVPQDSRCPLGVFCIWAGNAQVSLELSGQGARERLIVNSFDGAREVVYGSYRIGLVTLEPFPTVNGPIAQRDYRATLRVTPVLGACTDDLRPGIVVTLADSLSPSAQTFSNVSVVARDGAYRDSVFLASHTAPPTGYPIPLAHERAGVYELTVTADGYRTWVRPAVLVQHDPCHVVTVPLTARLAR